jgi:hypothetical protein
MGFYSLIAPCFVCGVFFASNPNRVPSYANEPICRDCLELVNQRRRQLGEPEWIALPGAYEPADELDGGLGD